MPVRAAIALLLTIVLAPTPAGAASCWAPPVEAPVVDPFRPPACVWCPANRGIEYGTVAGDVVRAVEGGEVSFAGTVAGTRYVVVRLADGRRTTYGNLLPVTGGPAPGDRVRVRAEVGRAAGHVLLTLRAAEPSDAYVDPAPFLGRPERPPRLVPVDGSPGRPSRPARLRCAAGS